MANTFWLFLLACTFLCFSEGLKCLQCFDYAPGGPCRHDMMGLVNTSKEIFPNNTKPYYKECLNGSNDENITHSYCVIEEFYESGKVTSFIRDCSDGKSFSFSGDQNADKIKLQQVKGDNFTSCVYALTLRLHVCLTLCDTDFCNAPRPPPEEDPKCSNDSSGNLTCGASGLMMTGGPFGPLVDQLLGPSVLLPLFVTMIILGVSG